MFWLKTLKKITTITVSAFGLLYLNIPFAQTSTLDISNPTGKYSNGVFDTQKDFESIDTFTGGLKLTFRDFYLPGNGGLDISINRHYDSKIDFHSNIGSGWSIDLGSITVPAAMGGSSWQKIVEICNGLQGYTNTMPIILYTNEGTNAELNNRSNTYYKAVFSNNWKLDCTQSTATQLIVRSTDGTKYIYGYSTDRIDVGKRYYLTKKVDTNGNYINIFYNDPYSGYTGLNAIYSKTAA